MDVSHRMSTRLATSKSQLRSDALARRDALSPGDRQAGSAAIVRQGLALLADLEFSSLSGFLPIGSECDPRAIMRSVSADGVGIALPAFVDRTTMIFRRYSEGDALVPAGFGTTEPLASAPQIDPDLLLMPLAAFDRTGARLGYGKGHYDRTIAALRARGRGPQLVGLAFSVQEVDAIPLEPHDVRLDWLVSETEILDFHQAPT